MRQHWGHLPNIQPDAQRAQAQPAQAQPAQ